MSDVWRIPEPIDVKGRRIVDTGGRPIFAHLIARLVPSDNPTGLLLEQEWEDPADSRWLPAIQQGIDQFVASRIESGRPVGFTTLVTKRVISHPIDTDDAAVIYHIKAVLHAQFRALRYQEITIRIVKQKRTADNADFADRFYPRPSA